MGAIVEVAYFNSYVLKSIGIGRTTTNEGLTYTAEGFGTWPGLPWNPPNYPTFPIEASAQTVEQYEYYVEEARIRGGYNNTSTGFGPRAYVAEEGDASQIFTNSLIYSGIFNSKTDVNETNVFSVAESITRSVDPKYGAIQFIHARDTDLTIFQTAKVSRLLIDKDAIYSAEGTSTITTAQAVIGTLTPYEGDYGISTQPESFAYYGFRRYFSDVNRGAIMRLSRDGLTEISQYGMSDYFRDQLSALNNEFQTFSFTDTINVDSPTEITFQNQGEEIQIGLQLQFNTGQVVYVESFVPASNSCTVTDTIVGTPVSVTATKQVVDKIRGSWDAHSKNYILSIQPAKTTPTQLDTYQTINFDDGIKGWVSFFTYKPTQAYSLKNVYYSFQGNTLWRHYSDIAGRNSFYGTTEKSSIEFVFNTQPSSKKVFQTINYEGYSGWEVTSFVSDETGPDGNQFYTDTTNSIKSYGEGEYTNSVTGEVERAGFTRKENLYTANLINKSTAMPGEVIFGDFMTGIKGYFAVVKLQTDSTTDVSGVKELFSVGSKYVPSS